MRLHTFSLAFTLLASTASFAQEAAAPKPHTAKKSGVIDCNKTPNVHLGNGKLKLTFTGVCHSVHIGSGMNEIVADTIVHLEIAGAMNRVLVSRVDTIQLGGAKNDITWSGTVDSTKTEPAVTTNAVGNVVKKGDKAAFDAGKDAAKKVDSKNVNAEAKKAEDDAKKAIDDATKGLGIKLN
jgi:hypothetical protein